MQVELLPSDIRNLRDFITMGSVDEGERVHGTIAVELRSRERWEKVPFGDITPKAVALYQAIDAANQKSRNTPYFQVSVQLHP